MKSVSSPLLPLPGLAAGSRRRTWQRLFSLALPLCLSICFTASPAIAQDPQQQQEPLLIGVLDLDANNVDAGEAKAITDRLRLYLGQTGVYRLIERNQMDNILNEVGFQLTGACDTDECVIQVGKILGARKMVAGSVSRVGTLYSLQIRLIDIESSSIEQQAFRDVSGIELVLTDATQYVAQQLAGLGATPISQPQPAPLAATGQINVTSGPSGANLTIDGQPHGTTPVMIEVDEGSHEVVVEMDGYAPYSQTVQVTSGRMVTVNATLSEVPSGFLNVTSTPVGATVLVDGNNRGRTPISRLRVSTGQHRVEVKQDGYDSYFQDVTVSRNRRLDIAATLERSGQASLMLESNFNGALIFIDGVQRTETTPAGNITLKPGPHTIRVKARGYSSWEQSVNLQEGSQEKLTVNLRQKSRFGAGFLGMIFPGGGHFYSGRGGMGTFVLLATAGAGAYAFMQSNAMVEAEDLYWEKYDEYMNASTTNDAQRLHNEMLGLHEDWDAAQKSASTAVMAAAGLHIFGVLHSAIFMPRLRPVLTSSGPTLSLKAGTRAGRASLTLSIIF